MPKKHAQAKGPSQSSDSTSSAAGGATHGLSGIQEAGGNSFAQALAGGGAGMGIGFKGDLESFLSRMERAYGLSDIDVVGGKEGDAGSGTGAVATTRGGRIFVSSAFADMDAGSQEGILAHEVGHLSQGQGKGGMGGDAEADATRQAQQALAGEKVEPGVSVTPGSSHNFGFGDAWDAVTGVVDDAVDAGADWAMKQIGSAAELLTFIGRFGETVGRTAINWLAEHKTEIVMDFIALAAGGPLLLVAVRAVGEERIASWLQSVDAKTAAKVVAAVIAAGAIALIAAPLLTLGPLAMPIIKELSGPTIAILWEYAPQEMKDMAKTALVDGWPVGLGLALDGSIGATFGYPVYLGVEAFFEVSHFTDGNFKMRRGGQMTEAFDTGVGAGGFIGLGGGKKGGGEGEGAVGIGAQAGAEFMAGLRQMVLQEFDFPVMEDNAFASFLIGVLQADTSASMSILSLMSPTFRAVNPISYNTMTKIEFKAFAEGNAGATAGVRTAGENTQSGSGTWSQNEGARDNGSAKWWQRWMSASVFGRIAGEAGVGFEMRNTEWTQDADGVRVPAKMEVDAYGEASAALAIVHRIPVISQALPQAPNFDGGGGIKVTWEITGASEDTEPTVGEPIWQLYGKTGSMDRYEGAASETTIALSNLNAETFESLESFLSNIRAGSSFKRRFMLGTTLGRKYMLAAKNQGAFNVMLPNEYKSYGFRIEGYMDLEATISANTIREVFRAIAAVVDGYAEGGAPLQQLYMDVLNFFSTGEGPAHVVAQLEKMANAVLAGAKKLHLHGLVGIGIAAGGQISEGAKIRLHGSVGGQVTMDHDLLSHVQGTVTVDDIKQLIQGAMDGGTDSVEVPGTNS